MKNVLILAFSNLKHDARVSRQLKWLSKENHLTVVCFDAVEIPGVNYVKLKQTKLNVIKKLSLGVALLLRLHDLAYTIFHDYAPALSDIQKQSFDLIIANDIDTLPLAIRIKKKASIIFDAHEYAPRHFENNRIWKIFFQPFYIHLCKKYIPLVESMTTVGKGLANEYKKVFNVEPVIITNATQYHEIAPSPVVADKFRLIHHGIANKSRKLELMIDMMNLLDDRFTLDMILMTSDFASAKTKTYIRELIDKASKNPHIKILPHVKSDQVVATINQYDMGVFLIPPINFNYANTLPNKLFDFIQARLGIAVGPTPEMAEIVKKYDLGIVSKDFTAESLAMELRDLNTSRIKHYKSQSAAAARILCAEKNEIILNTLITKVT